jgi:hypothetical protein
MFKIDLLNGAGLPPRSHPLLIAAGTLAFVVLAILAAFDGVHAYDVNRQIAGQQQSLLMYDRQIAGLADVAQMLAAAEKDAKDANDALKEKDLMLGTHRTWSPLLEALVKSAPQGLTISEIIAKREERKNVPQKGTYDYSVVLGVISPAGAAPVELLIQTLRPALPLQVGPDSIHIISQRYLQVADRDVQYYLIECRLK